MTVIFAQYQNPNNVILDNAALAHFNFCSLVGSHYYCCIQCTFHTLTSVPS